MSLSALRKRAGKVAGRRSERLHMLLSETEAARLASLADAMELTVSDVMRTALSSLWETMRRKGVVT